MGIERRTQREGETLIFRSPEDAADFTRRVEDREKHEKREGIQDTRAIVRGELEKKFEELGHGVAALRQPWEHTEEEHNEAQRLLEVAFAHDLAAAISQAEKSSHFPRNIDLFHDVATNEMYNAIVQRKVNVGRTPSWAIFAVTGVVVLLFVAVILFAYSV